MSEGFRIGITGGIGSGKSIISRIVRSNGFPVYDCDSEAKRIMTSDIFVKKELKEILGDETFNSKGSLNRNFVSNKIFHNIELRNKVNHIVHEAVKKDFFEFSESLNGPAFVESAILFTSGIDRICNEIWMVTALETIRLERVIKRNGFSSEEVEKRMLSQQKEFESIDGKKTIKIVNNGNNPILPEIISLLNNIKSRYQFKTETIC